MLQKLNVLEVELGENPNENVRDRYEEMKSKLSEIEYKHSRGSIFRSKAKFIEECMMCKLQKKDISPQNLNS